METTLVLEPRQPIVAVRLGLTVLTLCRNALVEWRKREKLRAKLDGLSDRELLDIGIARGEIDYVATCQRPAQRRPAAVNKTARSIGRLLRQGRAVAE